MPDYSSLKGKRIGFAFTGSFCTILAALEQLKQLVSCGAAVVPIFSTCVANTDTRFVRADEFERMVTEAAGMPPIKTIAGAEPIGPKRLLDLLVIAPCTGNSLAKLANGICDTPVIMAAKAHLRNGRPLILAPSTNDGLGASAQNIGKLMNNKLIYMVPMQQDDHLTKPNSTVACYELIPQTLCAALEGRQLQPVLLAPAK